MDLCPRNGHLALRFRAIDEPCPVEFGIQALHEEERDTIEKIVRQVQSLRLNTRILNLLLNLMVNRFLKI